MPKRCCAQMCFNSQMVNKSVAYFGFPKYEEFAIKWAIAAKRPDLLEKKINIITKYFLCSEHFTDDCFANPPHNTRLKKTSYPVSIPVPTIFKCNIDKFMPNGKRTSNATTESLTERSSTTKAISLSPSSSITSPASVNRTKNLDEISVEYLSVFHDHYNYLDLSFSTESLLNNIISAPQDSEEIANSIDNLDTLHDSYEMNSIIEEEPEDDVVEVDFLSKTNACAQSSIKNHEDNEKITNICRLCATIFPSAENLCEMATEPGLYDNLNVLLPDMINSNDDLPQMTCKLCLHRVKNCISALDRFKEAQYSLRKSYGIDS